MDPGQRAGDPDMPVSMTAMHETAVCRVNAEAARIRSECSGEVPDRIDDHAGVFRLLEIGDRNRNARREWLGNFLSWSQEYRHAIGATHFLSQAEMSFSLLVISGDDQRRVAKIVTEVREAYPGKIILPLISNGLPAERARLLRRGADDVLCATMPHGEAVARIYALLRRSEWIERRSRQTALRADVLMAAIRPVTKEHLSPREQHILSVLLSRPSHPLSYRALARSTGYRGEPGSLKSLRVTISLLRRKLVDGLQITSVRGEGYALSLGSARRPTADEE